MFKKFTKKGLLYGSAIAGTIAIVNISTVNDRLKYYRSKVKTEESVYELSPSDYSIYPWVNRSEFISS